MHLFEIVDIFDDENKMYIHVYLFVQLNMVLNHKKQLVYLDDFYLKNLMLIKFVFLVCLFDFLNK
jgi:hypothetical protein